MFTKGEWTVYESPFAPAVIIKDKPNRPNRIIVVCRLERGSEDMAEATANANLISAAPDMYEALIAWDELIAMRPLDSGADIDAILQKCAELSEKAIAKAESKP